MIDAATALQQAQVMGQMAGAEQSSSAMQAAANNQIMAGIFAQDYSKQQRAATAGPSGDVTGFMASGVMQATELVDTGMAPQVLGDEAYATASQKAQARVAAEGMFPGQGDYDKRVRQYIIGDLTLGMMQNPRMLEQVRKVAPALYENYLSKRMNRSTTTDNKGRTSVRETFDAE
jgi:hypothetical protein